MQDRSESWLDDRLGAASGWADAAPSSEVVVDLDAIEALAEARPHGSSAVDGAIVDDGSTWLASASVGTDVAVGTEISISASDLADLDPADVSVGVNGLEESLGAALIEGDASSDDDVVDEVSTIVDPFDVFIAESAAVDIDSDIDIDIGSDSASTPSPALDAEEPGDDPLAAPDLPPADSSSDDAADTETPQADAPPTGAAPTEPAQTELIDPAPTVGVGSARLDAFDAFDDPGIEHPDATPEPNSPDDPPHLDSPHLDDFE